MPPAYLLPAILPAVRLRNPKPLLTTSVRVRPGFISCAQQFDNKGVNVRPRGDWNEVPNNPCSRYDKQGDTITLINVATNQPRCKITKTSLLVQVAGPGTIQPSADGNGGR